jgi:hypothetical protein
MLSFYEISSTLIPSDEQSENHDDYAPLDPLIDKEI